MSEPAGHRPPTVYVIAGPNGAGKTTFAAEFLPGFVDCRQFVNADLIAAGLSPFAPETQNVKAGRLLLERIGELAAAREDFGFETTLSGRTHAHLLGGLKRDGYRVVLFFLWIPSADLAVSRVANRVRQGDTPSPRPTCGGGSPRGSGTSFGCTGRYAMHGGCTTPPGFPRR